MQITRRTNGIQKRTLLTDFFIQKVGQNFISFFVEVQASGVVYVLLWLFEGNCGANFINSHPPTVPMGNRSLIGELWQFLKVRKAWWLSPIILLLLVAGALIIFGQSSALSPFIYALF